MEPTDIPVPVPQEPQSAAPQAARERPLVLVADDDGNLREVVSKSLTSAGFDVKTAKSGEEALAMAKQLQPNLAILDVTMPPGPTGPEVALELKSTPEFAAVKILFLSGQDDPFPTLAGDKSTVSQELGAEDFVMKTENLSVLVAKAKQVLGMT